MDYLRIAPSRLALALASLALSCSDDGLTPEAADGGAETSAETGIDSTSHEADEVGQDDGSTGSADGSSDDAGAPMSTEVSGDAFAFTLPGTPYGRIDGATISILEQPELVTQTDAMGHFVLPAVPAGSEATFVLEADGFPPADPRFRQSRACDVPGARRRALRSDGGALDARGGPADLPDRQHRDARGQVALRRGRPRRSRGHRHARAVLFSNVPVGTYVMRAHKDGVTFEEVTLKCEAGVLTNASPPYGLQAL
jgi:hypothetical protein